MNRIGFEARLLLCIGPDHRCWLWPGSLSGHGYGMFRKDGQTQYAHRAAYELLVGPIPEGLELDHTCRPRPNKRCCNPAHMEPVSHAVNLQRIHDRNLWCKNGRHRKADVGYYVKPNGKRQCAGCRAEHIQRWNSRPEKHANRSR